MNNIVTDYTRAANADTYPGGMLQGYRLLHWLKDILRNFCADPMNIKDERLCGMFRVNDAADADRLDSLFRVGLPYSPRSVVKAGTTPVILVSLGETTYPVSTFGINAAAPVSSIGGIAMHRGAKHKMIKSSIAVVTESYDGTLLLENLIEDFLVTHELELVMDCRMISEFKVLGSSGPQELPADSAGNAKPLYQAVLQVSCTGGVSWISDTQGPVFRGVTVKETVKGGT